MGCGALMLTCAAPQDWGDWLRDNHTSQTEVLLRLFRKGSGAASVTWEEAVVDALAWGWIDSVKRPCDDQSWLQRFSPRKSRSVWSQKNRGHVDALIAAGRMQPAGMAHVTAAQGPMDAGMRPMRGARMP